MVLLTGATGEAPAWAPGGRRFVFSRSRLMTSPEPRFDWNEVVRLSDLHIYNLGTGRIRQLTPAVTDPQGPYSSHPAWSPNGSRIVYSRSTIWESEYGYTRNPADLFTISPRGGRSVRLTHTNRFSEEDASWSPSGRQIVYARMSIDDPRNPTHSLGLDVIAADGTDRSALIEGFYWEPTWSPGGRFVAAAKRNATFEVAEHPGLWRINATTGAGLRLRAGKQIANPHWGVRGR